MPCHRPLCSGSTCGRRTAAGWFAARVCAATALALAATALAATALAAPAPANPVAPAKPVEPAAPRAKQKAWLFKIPLPISSETAVRLRSPVLRIVEEAKKAGLQPVLIFEFAVDKNQEDFGRGSKRGYADELANFLSSQELNSAQTVAYLPRTVQGHAVLAALACRTIAMAQDAQIGPAGVDEREVTAATLSTYKEIAARGRKVPAEVAYKLVDASRELISVGTDDPGLEYTTPAGLAELGKSRTLAAKKVVIRAGQPGQFSGVEAKQRGFADILAANRNELAALLDLSGGEFQEEPWLRGAPKAVLVDVKGRISTDTSGRIQRMIQEAVRNEGVNCVILRIDSAGGLVAESLQLASYLAFELDPDKVQTIAYIPKEARADAALIALACDRIAMAPDAKLGGEGYGALAEGDLDEIMKFLREGMAVQKMRSWSIPARMFDPALGVSRYTKDGQIAFFCDAEWKAQAPPDPWRRAEESYPPGKVLLLAGEDAQAMPLGVRTFTSFPQMLESFGLEDPKLLETRWIDKLAAVLSSRAMAVFLLLVGAVALYIELHAPGISVPGFLALVCFALFFWGQFLGGTPVGLAIVLFLAGIVCVLAEVFVLPGMGVFGLGGGVLILGSFVLASQSFLVPRNSYEMAEFQRSLAVVVTAVVLAGGCITAINRWLPRAPFFGQIILAPPSREESETIARKEAMDEFHVLLGQRGRATTPLIPGGKARFHDTLYHVVTDGDFLPVDAEIEVVEVAGNRIVVRAAGG